MRAAFRDRADAGARLADALAGRELAPGALALGLPRGGVIVAVPVARRLQADLDVLVVRKLGVPGHEELAMGALAAGVVVRQDATIDALGIDEAAIERVIAREHLELERRETAYRGDRPRLSVRDRDVILIDDGLATGSTMEAAVYVARDGGARSVIVAVPCGPEEVVAALGSIADDVVCLVSPPDFLAVGACYTHFPSVTDDEVRRALAGAVTEPRVGAATPALARRRRRRPGDSLRP